VCGIANISSQLGLVTTRTVENAFLLFLVSQYEVLLEQHWEGIALSLSSNFVCLIASLSSITVLHWVILASSLLPSYLELLVVQWGMEGCWSLAGHSKCHHQGKFKEGSPQCSSRIKGNIRNDGGWLLSQVPFPYRPEGEGEGAVSNTERGMTTGDIV
jgi:hypothetical protein